MGNDRPVTDAEIAAKARTYRDAWSRKRVTGTHVAETLKDELFALVDRQRAEDTRSSKAE